MVASIVLSNRGGMLIADSEFREGARRTVRCAEGNFFRSHGRKRRE